MPTFLPPDLPSPVRLIVHVGAGGCSELPAWRESGARAILLVEAEAEAAARLAADCAGDAAVRVMEAAVSGDTTPRPFHVANFPDLSSLRRPTALRDLFPGLRVQTGKTLTPVDPVALLTEALAEGGKGASVLVLDAAGESLGILQRLGEAELLARFDAIRVQEARSPLYDGAPALDAIRSFLEDANFRLAADAAATDPDFPRLWALRDRAALDRAELKRICGDLTAERDRAVAEIAALKTEIETLRKETETLREQNDRLRAAEVEIAKAEAQLRLLRDLVLHGADL